MLKTQSKGFIGACPRDASALRFARSTLVDIVGESPQKRMTDVSAIGNDQSVPSYHCYLGCILGFHTHTFCLLPTTSRSVDVLYKVGPYGAVQARICFYISLSVFSRRLPSYLTDARCSPMLCYFFPTVGGFPALLSFPREYTSVLVSLFPMRTSSDTLPPTPVVDRYPYEAF